MIFDFNFWVCDFYQTSFFANQIIFPILAELVIPAAGMTENTDHLSVSALKPKIPEFWPHAANVWITQVNAQFRLCRITSSQTKFDYAVMRLGDAAAARVQDLLANPPATDPYEALVERLTAGFSKSSIERLSDFNALPPLGDRRPSELMDTISASLSGVACMESCPHVQYAFLTRLPVTVRSGLSHVKFESARAMALKADEVWSAVNASSAASTVSAVLEPPPPPPSSADADNVVAAVRNPAQPVRSSPARLPQSTRPAPQQQQQQGLCWYHAKFGNRASFCRPPCSWSGNGRTGGRH